MATGVERGRLTAHRPQTLSAFRVARTNSPTSSPTRPADRPPRPPDGFYVAGAAAAALVYFATMRLTRGMAASVCFLAMGRILS